MYVLIRRFLFRKLIIEADSPDQDEKINGREISLDPSSKECLSVANSWIVNCFRCHPACSSAGAAFPSRLIDVSSKSEPFLVENLRSKAPYITLSHCWGSQGTLTTTTTNLASRKNKISLSKLPKTFYDAVMITRMLKVQYLWIDSLCILQDSVGDWNIESIKMGEYYRCSYLTISALGSAHSHWGILNLRAHDKAISLLGEKHVFARDGGFSWDWEFANSPLSKRAWAFQERLMSTRILHFGKSEMFWECSTCSFREGNIKPLVGSAANFKEGGFEKIDLKRSVCASSLNSIPEPEIFVIWRRIVSHYSRLSLTRDSDKLPAISGLAALIQQAMHGRNLRLTYLSGLWKEDISSLLWNWAPSTNFQMKRVSSFQSWSWASQTYPIDWEVLEESTTTHSPHNAIIKEAVITPSLSNTPAVSQLQSYIILQASVMEVDYSRDLNGAMDVYDWRCEVTDLKRRTFGEGWLDRKKSLQKGTSRIGKAIWICTWATSLQNRPQTRGVWFLLVQRAELDNAWKRIGIGRTLYDRGADYDSRKWNSVDVFGNVEEIMLI